MLILLKSTLIALSLSTSCKLLILSEVIYVPISHSHTDVMITSTSPGLIMLFAISNTISDIMSTDSVDNFSDHLPVFFTLNCPTFSTHHRPISIGQTNTTSDFLSTKINLSKISEGGIAIFSISSSTTFPHFPAQLTPALICNVQHTRISLTTFVINCLQ